MKTNEITAEYAHECFVCNPDTGQLWWKERPAHHFPTEHGRAIFNAIYAGKETGKPNTSRGYGGVGLGGVTHRTHILIWLLCNGRLPEHQIDHIDGVTGGFGNRLSNLRDAPQSENTRNKALYKRNATGVAGVTLRKKRAKWCASIRVGGRLKHLYEGFDFFEACCRRKSAELKHDFHTNHGRMANAY